MKTILIVEDEKKLASLLEFRLKALGYDVLQCHDAFSAVKMAVQHLPDLILLDITLPGGDGYSVVERLQAVRETREIPFFFVTARTEPRLRQRAEYAGARRLFEKPFPMNELLKAVQAEIGEPIPNA